MLVDSILGRVIRTIGIFSVYLDNVIILANCRRAVPRDWKYENDCYKYKSLSIDKIEIHV